MWTGNEVSLHVKDGSISYKLYDYTKVGTWSVQGNTLVLTQRKRSPLVSPETYFFTSWEKDNSQIVKGGHQTLLTVTRFIPHDNGKKIEIIKELTEYKTKVKRPANPKKGAALVPAGGVDVKRYKPDTYIVTKQW